MIGFRSTVGTGGSTSNAMTYTTVVNKIPQQTTAAQFFKNNLTINERVVVGNNITSCFEMLSGCSNFNSKVIVGRNVSTCELMFDNCQKYNQKTKLNALNCVNAFRSCSNFNAQVIIGDNVENCFGLFYNCANYNQPMTISNNVKNCGYMFYNCVNFVQGNVTIPKNVRDCNHMYYQCSNLSGDIYINGNPQNMAINMMLYGTGTNRKNVYSCNAEEMRNVTGGWTGWQTMADGYYNSYWNIYLYNNYVGT